MSLSGTSITGGTINNGTGITTATAGIIDVTGASTIQGSSAPTVFANLNNGTVTLGAQLTLDEVKVSASQINEDTGGSIVLDDTVQLTNGATITGAPITNDGTLEVLGAASLVNDQLTNTGQLLQVDATQTLTLSGTSITGGTINNGTGITTATAGIIDVTGASTIQGSSAPTVFANLNNGTVTLGAQLTLDEVKVSASQINEDTGGSIVLDDTVQLTNGATITGAPITNDGTLEVPRTKPLEMRRPRR